MWGGFANKEWGLLHGEGRTIWAGAFFFGGGLGTGDDEVNNVVKVTFGHVDSKQ